MLTKKGDYIMDEGTFLFGQIKSIKYNKEPIFFSTSKKYLDLIEKYQDLKGVIENDPVTCLGFLRNYELSSIEATFEEAKDSEKEYIFY